MKARLMLMGLFACVLAMSSATMAADKARPNIVLLLADDWGFSDVGAFGGEIATPHIDELARRGMRFSNFHVTASCSPSRAMLLTGVDNHRNGVGNMRETVPRAHEGKPGYETVLNRRVVTVASLLRDGGYRTYVAGKWHVGKEDFNLPPARGFDRSIIQADSGSDNWETGKRYLDLTDKVNWFEDGKEAVMPADYYSSKYFVDRTIEYIDSGAKEGKPFFAYVAFQANHIPVQAPQEFIAKYKGRYDKGWAVLRQERRDKAIAMGLMPKDTPMAAMHTTLDWDALGDTDKKYQARRMEVYAAMADAMDHHVGRLVEHLKKTGEYDNTVFVFLSDNGPEASDPYVLLSGRMWLGWQYNKGIDQLGEKGAYSIIGPSWASAAASPLSTYKFYSGEGGIRVPLIISGAAGMPDKQMNSQADKVFNGFTHINDIAPTVLDLAQLSRPAGMYRGQPVEPMTGASLMPALKGQAQSVHAADKAIGYELAGNGAIFKGDYKLIRNIPPVGDGLWHLYDIRNDPGETKDLQASLPGVFSAMQADYAAYAKANGVLPMPEGYDPIFQVQTNALINVYVPRFFRTGLPVLAGLAVLVAGFFYMRKRRKTRTAQPQMPI